MEKVADPVGTWWVSVEASDPSAGPDVQGLGVRLAPDGSVTLVDPVDGSGWWRLAAPGRVVVSVRIGGWALESVLLVEGDRGHGRARATRIASRSGTARTLSLWVRRA